MSSSLWQIERSRSGKWYFRLRLQEAIWFRLLGSRLQLRKHWWKHCTGVHCKQCALNLQYSVGLLYLRLGTYSKSKCNYTGDRAKLPLPICHVGKLFANRKRYPTNCTNSTILIVFLFFLSKQSQYKSYTNTGDKIICGNKTLRCGYDLLSGTECQDSTSFTQQC
jgi:hypothetical protein